MQEATSVFTERHLSLKEAQDAFGVSERTIHRWITSGKLKSYKPGRDHRIPVSAMRQVMEESEVYPKLQAPLWSDEENERRDPHTPWLEFVNAYADRWEEKISAGGVDQAAGQELACTLGDLMSSLVRVRQLEKREQPATREAIVRITHLSGRLSETGAVPYEESPGPRARARDRREGATYEVTTAEARASRQQARRS